MLEFNQYHIINLIKDDLFFMQVLNDSEKSFTTKVGEHIPFSLSISAPVMSFKEI